MCLCTPVDSLIWKQYSTWNGHCLVLVMYCNLEDSNTLFSEKNPDNYPLHHLVKNKPNTCFDCWYHCCFLRGWGIHRNQTLAFIKYKYETTELANDRWYLYGWISTPLVKTEPRGWGVVVIESAKEEIGRTTDTRVGVPDLFHGLGLEAVVLVVVPKPGEEESIKAHLQRRKNRLSISQSKNH